MYVGSFTSFEGSLYVAASNLFGNFPENANPASAGSTVYRLASSPFFVRFSGMISPPTKHSITLSWETAGEQGCSGFNVSRSSSNAKGQPYKKLTRHPLPSAGSDGQAAPYSYTDKFLRFGTTYLL